MISCDTNVMLAAVVPSFHGHAETLASVKEAMATGDFVLCEQVLMELYCLLRNPKVVERPMSAPEAVAIIQGFRRNPRLKIIETPQGFAVSDRIWEKAGEPGFARRRIYDVKIAETLKAFGVTTFLTRNVKDYQDLGFPELRNPFPNSSTESWSSRTDS